MKTVISKAKLIEDLTKAKQHYEGCKSVLEKDGGGLLVTPVWIVRWRIYHSVYES